MTQLWNVYRSEMNPRWNNTTANNDNNNGNTTTSKKKSNKNKIRNNNNNNNNKMKKLFINVGNQIESLIDSSFLGVPDPQPWSPLTDKRAAALSKPVASTVEFLEGICRSVEGLLMEGIALHAASGGGGAGRLCHSGGGAGRCGGKLGVEGDVSNTPFAALVLASQKLLMRLREGLANAIREEEEAGATAAGGRDLDLAEEGGYVVDLRPREEEGQHPESQEQGCSDTSSEEIVVTPDDCSVECSVASYVELSDAEIEMEFEECPSVVTECASVATEAADEEEAAAEEVVEGKEAAVFPTTIKQELNATQDMTLDDEDEDDEYVMTEEPALEFEEDEDFVNVGSEFDLAYCP